MHLRQCCTAILAALVASYAPLHLHTHRTHRAPRLNAAPLDDALPPPRTDELSRRVALRAAALAAALAARPASGDAGDALRVLVAEDDMVAPPLDARRYRLVALPNGMRALLVSDPAAETSAAALDVKVGFLSDPWDRPGLAHFCEHMLFLGNAKYPAEGEWRSFLETRGGSSNAYTAAEDTCFYFDVDAGDFDAALDRFAQFFVSPTFSASGVNRELEAIESEDSKNQQSDGFRLLQLDRSARGAATEDHPARKFGTGNRATLLQRGDRSADVAENAPKGDYNSLRRALVDHYDRFYDADHMALVVLGRDPLDALERSVARRFGDVRRGAGGDRRPAAAWAGKPALRAGLADGGLAPALLAAPVGATRRLSLSWRFPYDGPGAGAMDKCDAGRRENLRYKPGSLVSSVVGDEGAGSLLSWAKQQGYASGITSFASGDGSCDGRFDVSFELTKKGLNFWPDLVAATVGAVASLKASGVPRYRAEELDALNELNWRFSEPARPGQLAKALVTNVQEVGWDASGDDGTRLLSLFRRSGAAAGAESRAATDAAVAAYLAALTLDKLRITVVAREFLADGDFWGPLDRRERWYGTRYKEYAFDAPSIASLAALRAPPRGGVALPKPNKFLPRDLRIRFPPGAATPAVEAVDAAAPESLGDASGWTGRYAGDRYFNRPRAIVFAGARVLSVVEDPTSAMLGKIWRLSALDSLQERLWPARVAGLQYSLEVGGRGVSLSFSGYADGLGALARDVCGFAAKHAGPANAGDALRYVDLLRRDLQTKFKPYETTGLASTLALTKDQPSDAQLLAALDGLASDGGAALVDRVRRFSRERLWAGGGAVEAAGADVLVEGNFDRAEAAALFRTVAAALPLATRPPPAGGRRPAPVGLALPRSCALRLGAESIGPDEAQNACELVVGVGAGRRATALANVYATLLKATFFDTLRTKEQLGYVVQLGLRALPGAARPAALVLLVQGDAAPAKLAKRLAAFVENEATAAVARLDDAGLASVVAGLVAAKLEPDRRLFDQTGRHWEEIRRCRDAAVEGAALAPDWVRRYEAAETLKSLTAAEVRDYWTSTVRPGVAGTFGVEVYGRRAAPEPPREGQLVARSPVDARRFLAPLDLPVS